jgi:ribose 5-phosphate isomerase B
MRVAFGSDHAGFALKEVLKVAIAGQGHEVLDLGTFDGTTSVDYPDFGAAVGRAVASGQADSGVCVCGSGIGISMAANKVAGVRAALVHDVTTATLARQHNDANVVCLGSRITGETVALGAVQAFLSTRAQHGRHDGRIAKLDQLDHALVHQSHDSHHSEGTA